MKLSCDVLRDRLKFAYPSHVHKRVLLHIYSNSVNLFYYHYFFRMIGDDLVIVIKKRRRREGDCIA